MVLNRMAGYISQIGGKEIIKGLLLTVLTGWLVWGNILGSVICLPVFIIYMKMKEKRQCLHKQQAVQMEFKDMMAVFYSSIAAGGTIEKAFKDAAVDLQKHCSRYPYLLPELEKMCHRLERNYPLDKALSEFASASEDADISRYVQILLTARKSGSSMTETVKYMTDTMIMRMEVNSEIQTILAGKKGEWKIMMIVPAAILIYMNLFSANYMVVLYQTAIGHVLMLSAMGVYIAAVVIGNKITDIAV